MKIVSVLKDFGEYPGLRNCSISDNSGEQFYHQVLNKTFKEAFEKKEKLIIDLDNTAGYAISFLDEAFGNLVYDFSLTIVKQYIEIISLQEPHWIDMLEKDCFPQWEKRRLDKKQPKVTERHASWYRLVDNNLKLDTWIQPAP